MDAPPLTLLPSPEALPCAEVTIFSGEMVILRRMLPVGDYTIGRDAACHLVVNVAGVSRRHVTLSLGDRTTRVHDLGSMNGTFIDGQRVALTAAVRNGEAIILGSVATLRIERVATPQPDNEAAVGPNDENAMARQHFCASAQTEFKLDVVTEGGSELSALKQQLAEVIRARDQALSSRPELEKLRGKVTFLTEARDILLQQLSTAAERLNVPGQCSSEEADYLRREAAALEQCLTNALDQRRQLEERCKVAERAARRARERAPNSEAPATSKRVGARAAVIVGAVALTSAAFMLAWEKTNKANERARRAESIVAQLRPFADGFRNEALEFLARRSPSDALARISCAIGLDPGNVDYHVIHGHICESILRIAEARAAYARALELDPRHAVAKENILLCERILATRAAIPGDQSLYGLHRLMMKQGRFGEALAMADRLAQDRELLRDTWQAILARAGLGGSLARLDDGTFELNLSSAPSANLAALAGMPLSALDLSRSGVTDLSPLAGLPLRVLDISRTRVRDLSPLRGLPIHRLNLADTAIIDLDPLAASPLEQLDISGTNVSDLSALSGMPLRVLRMAGAPVRDIAPLIGVPLRELDAARTRVTEINALRSLPLETLRIDHTEVRDLTAIAGAPLQRLSIPHTPVSDLGPLRESGVRVLDLSGCAAITTLEPLASCTALERLIIPRQCRDVKALKSLPRLRFLSFETEDGGRDYDRTAAEFWREQGETGRVLRDPVNARLQSNLPSDNPAPSRP